MESEADSDGSDVVAGPPKGLLQTARDISGRQTITLQELLRAWDASARYEDLETRATASLDILLAAKPTAKRAGDEPETSSTGLSGSTPRAKNNAAPSGPGTFSRKRSVIQIDDDDSEDDMPLQHALPRQDISAGVDGSESDSDVQLVPTSKGKGKPGIKVKHGGLPSHAVDGRGNGKAFAEDEGEAGNHARKKRKLHAGDIPAAMDVGTAVHDIAREEKEAYDAGSESGKATRSSTSSSPLGRAGSTPLTSAPQSRDNKGPPDSKAERLAEILTMVPDVDPTHAEQLVEHWKEYPNCVEFVIDVLFSGKPYPKAASTASSSGTGKGKGKEVRKEIDYLSIKGREAPSPSYAEQSFNLLQDDFPAVPKPYIRKVHMANLHLYAPAYFQLLEDIKQGEESANAKPSAGGKSKGKDELKMLAAPRRSKGKGKESDCEELRVERQWVLAKVARDKAEKDAQLAADLQEKLEEEAGHVFECGCCFGDYVFSKMVQCPEAHLFCTDCARKNAESIIGLQQTELHCMDQDGCKAQFTLAECQRFLKPVSILLLEKLRSAKAIDQAGLEGLSKCPHCPWACVIENEHERLFRCGNSECMKITCRNCQKADHLPKTCEEYASDLKANNIHKVEEAMTEALLRKCPKCSVPILKEYGCNKMTCQNCRTLFCFICQQQVEGYHHFKGQYIPGNPQLQNETSTCVLWDRDSNERLYNDVETARKAAVAELLRAKEEAGEDGDDITEEELKKLELKKLAPADPRYPPGYADPYAGIALAQAALAQAALAHAAIAVPPAAHPYGIVQQPQQGVNAAAAAWNPYVNVGAWQQGHNAQAAVPPAPVAVAPPRLAQPPAGPAVPPVRGRGRRR